MNTRLMTAFQDELEKIASKQRAISRFIDSATRPISNLARKLRMESKNPGISPAEAARLKSTALTLNRVKALPTVAAKRVEDAALRYLPIRTGETPGTVRQVGPPRDRRGRVKKSVHRDVPPLVKKSAQAQPNLIGIPGLSPQEVRQTYNELEAMHNARVKKLKTLRPGSLRYRYNQRMARLHRQDADSFLADK